MAVPPPQGDQETETVAFGIAAVDGLLEAAEVQFPATGEEIERAVGDPAVPYDPGGHTIPLSTVLESVDDDTFDSRQEFLNAIHPVFEAKRSGSGGLDWLRSILPF